MVFQLVHPVTAFRQLTYLVSINETMFPSVEKVPDMVGEAVPYFFILIAAEFFICIAKQHRRASVPDSIGSVSAGLYSQVVRFFFRGFDFVVFCFVYERFQILQLPWDSAWTWIFTMLGVDFCYYWLHRASHEVNLFWSGHQVHHSSEFYNLTTALRQSILQPLFSAAFYIPLALCVPPQAYLVHAQLSLLYQFWIHTELVKSIGPLEWVLNTPSHHRVHHGRNPYCINKNYGGTLIVWDRLFGTFEAERDDEPVVYGLVHPLDSMDPHEVQYCHLKAVMNTALERQGILAKLKTFFYGPGWMPGYTRLGEDVPPVTSREVVYNPEAGVGVKAYCVVQFLLANGFYVLLLSLHQHLPALALTCGVGLLLLALTVFGNLLDERSFSYGLRLEVVRCVLGSAAGHAFCPQSAVLIDAILLASCGVLLMLQPKKKIE